MRRRMPVAAVVVVGVVLGVPAVADGSPAISFAGPHRFEGVAGLTDDAIAADGEAVAAAEPNCRGSVSPTCRVVRVATRAATGRWNRMRTLARDAGAPSVAMNARGGAAVIWTRHNAPMAVMRRAGRAWSAPTRLAPAPEPAFMLVGARIGLTAGGGAVAAWNGADGMRVATFDGRTWSAPLTLGAGPATAFTLDVSSTGRAVLLWTTDRRLELPFDRQDTGLSAAIRQPTGQWSTPEDLTPLVPLTSIPAAPLVGALQATITPDGRVTALVGAASMADRTRVLDYAPATGWTAQELALGADEAFSAGLDVNRRGDAVLGWIANRARGQLVAITRRSRGMWSQPTPVSAADARRRPASAEGPVQVAIDDRGRTWAAWTVPTLGYDRTEAPDPPKTRFGVEAATGSLTRGWRAPLRLSRPMKVNRSIRRGSVAFIGTQLAVAGRGQAIVGWTRWTRAGARAEAVTTR